MPTRYEYFEEGEESGYREWIYGNYWACQTFTPQTSHQITSVKIKAYHQLIGSTVTVGIRATAEDEWGQIVPTGGDLASGTFDDEDLPLSWDYTSAIWVEIPLAPTPQLSAGVTYAIVVRKATEEIVAWVEGSDGVDYPRGEAGHSEDSGATWTMEWPGIDYYFEEWGEPVGGWSGKIGGVTNPGKVGGTPASTIAKVKGVS